MAVVVIPVVAVVDKQVEEGLAGGSQACTVGAGGVAIRGGDVGQGAVGTGQIARSRPRSIEDEFGVGIVLTHFVDDGGCTGVQVFGVETAYNIL